MIMQTSMGWANGLNLEQALQTSNIASFKSNYLYSVLLLSFDKWSHGRAPTESRIIMLQNTYPTIEMPYIEHLRQALKRKICNFGISSSHPLILGAVISVTQCCSNVAAHKNHMWIALSVVLFMFRNECCSMNGLNVILCSNAAMLWCWMKIGQSPAMFFIFLRTKNIWQDYSAETGGNTRKTKQVHICKIRDFLRWGIKFINNIKMQQLVIWKIHFRFSDSEVRPKGNASARQPILKRHKLIPSYSKYSMFLYPNTGASPGEELNHPPSLTM